MIPLNCLDPIPGWPPYIIKKSKISDFKPGKDIGLDVICNGILNGTSFVYPTERVGWDF